MHMHKGKLFLLSMPAIATVAIFYVAQSWNSSPTGIVEPSANNTESATTETARTTLEPRSRSGRDNEIDSQLREQLASMPRISLYEFQTVGDALQSIAAWSEMNPRDVMQNAMWWKEACAAVRTPTGRFPPMLESEPFRSALVEFESFCSGIEDFEPADAPRIESAEDVDEIFDRIENAMASRPEPWPDKIERLGREGALEAAFKPLLDAIRNLDEDKTRASIGEIVRSGLYPRIEETGQTTQWVLYMLDFALAHALLCQRMDGCIGPAHPYIVKYCLTEYKFRNRYCDSPNSIDDAIYQTLTPVEFQNYLQFYSWMTFQLTRLGRQ